MRLLPRELLAALRPRAVPSAASAHVDARLRTAHEMQELVTHGLAQVTVQAAAARRLLRTDPETADRLLADVETAGRAALDELRKAHGVLRPLGDAVARRPLPGLGELDELLDRCRTADLDVRLVASGAPVPLDPAVALTAYRVVESALDAARGRARVHLAWRPDGLDLEVERTAPPADLLVLGERVRAYGGRLRACAGPGGAACVSVSLPAGRIGA